MKVRMGNYVRISRVKHTFEKVFVLGWTYKIFKVIIINHCDPRMYYLEDMNFQPIHGGLYAHKIQLTKFPNTYLVEKLLRKSKNSGHGLKCCLSHLSFEPLPHRISWLSALPSCEMGHVGPCETGVSRLLIHTSTCLFAAAARAMNEILQTRWWASMPPDGRPLNYVDGRRQARKKGKRNKDIERKRKKERKEGERQEEMIKHEKSGWSDRDKWNDREGKIKVE
ncbi:hypothetical protein PR048_011480 [Dryococelus australis]|uniref:Uncharacterized protein n=1 Tax=Dryococelus australis TaxID=614101 RepID=A0ABQ9HLP8_9NEOP|nr:hypothetical protein PR048_011480 [Dryococelus australis]